MASAGPSWRKGAGIFLVLLLIILWGGAIVLFAPYITRWPVLVQAMFYLFMGIAWVIPLKPLLRWTETGASRMPTEKRGG